MGGVAAKSSATVDVLISFAANLGRCVPSALLTPTHRTPST